MTWLWTTLLWLIWAAILLAGGFVSLFILAFAGDAPQNRRAAQRLVWIAVGALAGAGILSYRMLLGRDSWTDMLAGFVVAALPVPALFLAIKLTFPR